MMAKAKKPKKRFIPVEERAVALAIVQLKHRAGRAGLWQTAHLLDEAQTAVGWEIHLNVKDREVGRRRVRRG